MLKECRELREMNVQEIIGDSTGHLYPMRSAGMMLPYIEVYFVPMLRFWGSVAEMIIKVADCIVLSPGGCSDLPLQRAISSLPCRILWCHGTLNHTRECSVQAFRL